MIWAPILLIAEASTSAVGDNPKLDPAKQRHVVRKLIRGNECGAKKPQTQDPKP